MESKFQKVVDLVNEGVLTPEEALAEASKDMETWKNPFLNLREVSLDSLVVELLPCGFTFLDERMAFKKGRSELILLGGGTSHGKSQMMLQIASHIARQGPVFLFSLEMDERDIKARLLAKPSKQPLGDILKGTASKEKLLQAEKEFPFDNLKVVTNYSRNITKIKTACLNGAKLYGSPLLIVIDYVQLVKGAKDGAIEKERISMVMGELKELAIAHKCPVLIGSQFSRERQKRGKKHELETGTGDYVPMVSDLYGSGSLEHDADVIIFITRPEVDNPETGKPGVAHLTLGKQRNGAVGSVEIGFTSWLCHFQENTKHKEESTGLIQF